MLTEDLDVFFNTAEMAVSATYDTSNTIAVIFDRAFLDQLGVVAGTEPVALVQATDVAADPVGKPIIINSVTYSIRGFEPQDDGAILLLRLQKAT